MKKFSCKWLGLAVGSVLLCYVAQAQMTFTLTDLGTLGDSYSIAYGINANGDVVGEYVNQDDSHHCFLYSKGVLATIMPSMSYCQARAINSKGQIAASAAWPGHHVHAFRYEPNGTYKELQPGAGMNADGGGFGIDTAGNVFGYSQFPNDVAVYPAKYSSAGGVVNLGNLFGEGIAWATNGTQVVGGSSGHAFQWSKSTGMVELGPGEALTINSQGYIAGDRSASPYAAALWYGGQVQDLGWGYQSMVWGMSDDNWMVGQYFALYTYQRPALQTPDCKRMVDLNTLVDHSGAGWILESAQGINKNHQIVGYGYLPPNGGTRAFLLTPNQGVPCP
jgi:probable HAF family extracellular repeat protein